MALSALAALSRGVVSTGTAGADHVSCGAEIITNTALHADVGPCPGDGLVIRADNVTLDLNGHRVFGAHGPGDGDAAGIRLPGRSGVVVKNGTVSGFDAGVVIGGGSGNTVDNLVVRDNVGPDDYSTATLGDGIALFSSAKNTISNNVIARNGIYDGRGVLGWDSNANNIVGNRVEANVGSARDPWFPGAGTGIVINPAANGQLNFDLKDCSDADGDHVVDGKCNSVWYGNTWGSAGCYPGCVTKGGTGPNPQPKPGKPSTTASAYPTGLPTRAEDLTPQGARFAGERPVRYA